MATPAGGAGAGGLVKRTPEQVRLAAGSPWVGSGWVFVEGGRKGGLDRGSRPTPPHHTTPHHTYASLVQVQAQNLMILQRKDEAVSEILATATYVVIYVFEPKGKQWERKEVRGQQQPPSRLYQLVRFA